MGRFFVPITIDELRSKFNKYLDKQFNTPEYFIEMCAEHFLYKTKIIDDLRKINFDFENVSATGEGDSCCVCRGKRSGKDDLKGLWGFNTLPNGLSFLGIQAGGDWEIPVFFIIYWDGKRLRGYVPNNGNTFNEKTKAAYGNEQDYDLPEEECDACNPVSFCVHWDADALIEDITNRIIKKG